jgi:POT family proton-dependent oligopeptide transporter
VGFGLVMPVTWFQALDSLAVLILAPLAIWLWRWQGRRGVEADDLSKITRGCGWYGASCLLLAAGAWIAGDELTWIAWPVAFHFIVAIGYLYAAPIALSLVSRVAPPAVVAMMVGAYYLAIFVGGILSGWLGRFYEPLQPAAFWTLHAAIGLAGAALLYGLRSWFLRALRLDAAEPTAIAAPA